MIKPKKFAIALMAVAGGMITSPAMAQNTAPTYNGAAFYKDNLGNIYAAPGSSNVSVSITITGAVLTKAYGADRCGVVSFKFPNGVTPPASISVDSTTTDLTTSTTITSKGWTCDKVTGTNTAKVSGATLPSSSTPIVNVGNTYYFYKTALTQHLIQYTGETVKSLRINACGFGKISYTAAQTFPSTATIAPTVGSLTPVAMSALATVSEAPACKSGTLLLPAGWTS